METGSGIIAIVLFCEKEVRAVKRKAIALRYLIYTILNKVERDARIKKYPDN